jgi:hypothetical protein
MSAEPDSPNGRTLSDEIDRKVVLKMLESALGEAHRKIDSGRVRDEEKEKVRQKWCRTLGYLAGQFRQLKNDKEIEGLKERIERLEQQREHGR